MTQTVTSPRNPRVRAALALRDRRDRERQGRFLIDGARETRRALAAGLVLDEIFTASDLCRSEDCEAVLAEVARRGIPRVEVGERAFERLAFGDRGDGVVAVAQTPSLGLSDLRLPSDPLVVVLEGVEKPGNLGAVLRSADGAGASAVIVAGEGVDPFNPNVIRASLGTVFHVPLAVAPTADVRAWIAERGIRLVAAVVDAERSYTDADLGGAVALVLGSEAGGLTDAWRGADGEAVRVPMLGIADSLNVAATAAILLYEARRQRDTAGRR